jgi:aminopeptidase N
LEIALVREEDNAITVASLPATIDSADAPVPGATGLPAPALVFPNHNDHAYAKVALDPESVAFARENLERIDDPLLRQLLWSSLWNMVRDQQLKSTDFLALVRERAAKEPMIEVIEPVLAQAQTTLARYVPEDRKDGEAHAFFLACWDGLRQAPQGDAQITWVRTLIGTAIDPGDLALVARLADGQEQVPGLTVDQQMRWDIAVKHVAYAIPGAAERLTAEAARDPSDRGQRARLRGDTSAPDAAVKAAAWERFHGDGYGSLYLTAAAMGGFNWAKQRDLLEPYVEGFFTRVPGVFETRDKEFYSDYFGALFPAYRVERAILQRSEALLAGAGEGHPALARMLREANDDLLRSIRCREFADS